MRISLTPGLDERPGDLTYDEAVEPGRARIALAPSRRLAIPRLLLAFFWDAILIGFYGGMLSSPKPNHPGLFFPIPHVPIGLFLTWTALARLLNTVAISFEAGRFAVRQGPIPGRGLDVPLDAIDSFDFHFQESPRGGGKVKWSVRVLTKDGKARRLPLVIDRPEHVQYVAARLSAALATVCEPTGYRDEPWRFRAPAASMRAEAVEEAPLSEPGRATRAR
jgi:hypothetical protein